MIEGRPAAPESEDLAVAVMGERLRARMFGAKIEIRRVGQYALVKQLGVGAQGSVWAAYDEKLDRRVAIKLLGEFESKENAEARLLKEARALAKLSHPNVVSVFEADDYEGGIYVVMEFIRGRTVTEWIAEDNPQWEQVIQVYRQAGKGLAAAHDAGLVHRDVKPDNVLVDAEMHAKLVDFGLVKRDPGKSEPSEATSSVEMRLRNSSPSTLTEQGFAVGTPLFMAPEQLRRGEATARSDQFALCVAMYQGVYGMHPFEGGTAVERMLALAEGRILMPPADSPVSAPVRMALVRGLAPDAAKRHESIRALLEAIAAPEPETSDEPGSKPDAPRWVWAAVFGLVLAVVAILALGAAE